jgi:hypothetical protein
MRRRNPDTDRARHHQRNQRHDRHFDALVEDAFAGAELGDRMRRARLT